MIAKIIGAHKHENHIGILITNMQIYATVTVRGMVTIANAIAVEILIREDTAAAGRIDPQQLTSQCVDNLLPPSIGYGRHSAVGIYGIQYT